MSISPGWITNYILNQAWNPTEQSNTWHLKVMLFQWSELSVKMLNTFRHELNIRYFVDGCITLDVIFPWLYTKFCSIHCMKRWFGKYISAENQFTITFYHTYYCLRKSTCHSSNIRKIIEATFRCSEHAKWFCTKHSICVYHKILNVVGSSSLAFPYTRMWCLPYTVLIPKQSV